MKRFYICISLVCAAAAGAAPLEDLSGGQTGRIEFRSTSPESRYAMIRNDKSRTKDTVVWGDLYMPKNATGKVPAVVLSHGVEGIVNTHDTPTKLWVRSLNEAGVAAFLIDSYSPRSLGNLGGEKTLTQNVALNISDSLHALKILSTHPHIDSDRIFNVGWSLGGVVAVDGAFPAISRYILPEGMHWAGSVGMYGGCNIKWRADHLGTNYSPVLMLLGEIDDNTPASYCVDYARNLAREGHKVTYKVYPGAGHDFDRYEENPIKFRHGIFSSCDVEVKMSLEAGGPGTGYDFVQKKSLTSWDDVGSSITACQKMANVTIAGQRKAREQSVKDVLEFINVTTKR